MPRAALSFIISLSITYFFFHVQPTNAQDLDDVTIYGLVTDERGAVLPRASITATLLATKAERTVVADEAGRYRLVELSPGAYSVRVSSQGFAVAEQARVETLAGQSVQLDFVLRPAGVDGGQVIVVSEATTPLVDATRTLVGGTLTRAEIETLPTHSRSPLDFIFTLGGVTEEPLSLRDVAEDRDARGRAFLQRAAQTPEEAGTFALSGGAAFSNNLTIDGLDNNDDRAARERFTPPLEAVAEVQVVTNQFSAEYGRASGGRVNLRTRSGSDDLRGRVFYFFRDEALDSNTFNNNRRGLKRLPFQRHTQGFTLSGPLILPHTTLASRAANARMHFFVAYEFDTTLDSTLVDALVPVERSTLFTLPAPTTLVCRRREILPSDSVREPAELAPFVERVSTPMRAHNFTARLDHTFGDAHNSALLLQLGRLKNLRQFGGGLRLANSLQGRTRDTEAVSYTDNLVVSPRVVNQLRAQLSRLRPAFRALAEVGSPVVLISIEDPLQETSGTLVAGSSDSGASDRRETRFQLQDSLTILSGSEHSFKLGADVHRISSTFVDLADASGTYSFASAADFLAASPSRFRQRFNTTSTQKNTYTSLFLQDEWRVRPSLTLTLGLRYEHESVLRDGNNFAPRFGLAFDPFGTGRTVVRLGAGIFYGRALLRTLDDFTIGESVVTFDTNALHASLRRAFIDLHLRFPAPLDADSPLVRDFGTRALSFARRLDPDLRIPESYQANAGFERELPGSLVFEANYTFHRGLHLWREFNANAPQLPRGFRNFTDYLLSRDFANFRDASGARPLFDSQTAGELVRFTTSHVGGGNTDAVGRALEFGVPVSLFNLNSVGSATTLAVALNALRGLRPDPSRGQIEQLASLGNSFYHGLTLELRRRSARIGGDARLSFRVAYTLSRLIDDGVVNTSDALRVGDFRAERAASLLDRRQRFVFSGVFDAPARFGALRLATILRLASGAPFNLSLGGLDRNLDDVSNDRPDFNGDLALIRERRAGEPLDARLLDAFSLPAIGRTGNLPRNAGRGPAVFTFDLNLTREFRLSERTRLRPVVEVDNVLNKTVHTFGAEFIDFTALRPDATPEQRRAFLDTFLVPTRTLRQRTIRLGLRLDF
ncbi:MAG TPA: TonB-dependent receptor [Pyrinomonadaceae bacterium]|nr:TonB-dependent receptor [Pyrinomonadaceae bacterium]